MELYCTRPGCPRPVNLFTDLDDPTILKSVQQKFCTACGMQLILDMRYLPRKLLGQGGFGAAFLACDRRRPGFPACVVKQFQPSGKLSPAQLQLAQELFEREAEVLEQLGNAHPLIPDLYAFFELSVPGFQAGKEEKLFYLVQEYIDGHTMEEELEQNGVISEAALLEMLVEILRVLKFVHENGSIHRDIKPSNIMRHRNGRFYLLDFGAVKQATKGGANTRSTGIYSMGFAPPEQMAGAEVYPSTDLYALAVTCIMLLTGKQPTDLFDSYSNSWKWEQDAAVSDRLAIVLNRMLVASPSQRFQSAEEVLHALQTPAGSPPHPSPPRPRAAVQPVAPSPMTALPNPPAAATVPATTLPAVPAPSPAPPSPPVPANPPAPVKQRSAIAPFSLVEILAGAGFTGFEAGLLAIALVSVLGTTLISGGFWLVLLAILVFAQSRRVIEGVDLLIISGVTLAVVLFVSPLHVAIVRLLGAQGALVNIVIVAALVGAIAIGLTTLFRLIYSILSRII